MNLSFCCVAIGLNVAITTLISIGGFYNQKIKEDLIFYPPAISEYNQWYRFFTCGLIHADVPHLAFNMYALYMFGNSVESEFSDPVLFGGLGKLLYILLYVTALIACLLPTYTKHKHNAYYSSLGASGAISGVLGAYMLQHPTRSVHMWIFFFIVAVPAFLAVGIWFVFQVINGMGVLGGEESAGGVAYAAHIGGFIAGLLLVKLFVKKKSGYLIEERKPRW